MSSGTYFKEYCNYTGIHGFRYFAEDRSVFEKILWIVLFLTCFCCCLFTIYAIYAKWTTSPVIVNFSNKERPIQEIPFPAVTVCSESKIKAGAVDLLGLYAKAFYGDEPLNQTQKRYLNYLLPMCQFINEADTFKRITRSGNGEDVFDTMEEITPHFEIINCRLWGIKANCSDIFVSIITDEGPCYTSNILDRQDMFTKHVIHWKNYHLTGSKSEWSPDRGYSRTSGFMTYPKRALLSGARYSLQFDLKIPKKDENPYCRQAEQGFRVLLHSPWRMPRMRHDYITVPYDQRVSGSIRPSTITTSDAVRKYSPKKRRCYFPNEPKLGLFRTYTEKNCVFECLTNVTLSQCGCVEFFMPRFRGTRICGASDHACVKRAEYQYQIYMLRKRVKNSWEDEKQFKYLSKIIGKAMAKCICMPLCSDLEYHLEMSQSAWPWRNNFDYENQTDDFHLTRFSLYFVSNDFIGCERNELYGPIDFLANFGGLLGFFTGFSILSLMEIIYFLSVRILCNLRLYTYSQEKRDTSGGARYPSYTNSTPRDEARSPPVRYKCA